MIGKERAAKTAAELVEDGMILGIGSGSTVELFLRFLGERIRRERLRVYGVPSSYQSHIIAVSCGIRVVDLFEYGELDLCVDGADQVDARMNCVKGGGAAMTREKVVAAASRRVVIIVDESKLAEKLSMPVPVEVLPFAYGYVARRLEERAKEVKLRTGSGKVGPLITDNGNFILDCDFGVISEPKKLELELNSIPGVIENGVFPADIVDSVVVGSNAGARILE
ncbi:MAG: ribose-5-phosphate isomerase RpiA [Archaeoglobaceae archaeon]